MFALRPLKNQKGDLVKRHFSANSILKLYKFITAIYKEAGTLVAPLQAYLRNEDLGLSLSYTRRDAASTLIWTYC